MNEEADASIQDSGSASAPPTDSVRLLLTDDSASIRRFVGNKLRELWDDSVPLIIDEAADGRQAVQQAERQAYDAIFLDVDMPGLDGLEACCAIKRITNTRVVMLSSLTTATDHRNGRNAGCDNYLTKPPNDSDLKVILRLISINTGRHA